MAKKKKSGGSVALLIVLAVLAVAMIALFVFSSKWMDNIHYARNERVKATRAEVDARNEALNKAFSEEWAAYEDRLKEQSTSANTAWPEAAAEGWDVIDLTNYPLEVPGSVTVNRADLMAQGNSLLLVNEWHSRPEDFDETAIVSLSGYARQSETGLSSFWYNSSRKLYPVAIDALVAALKDAKAVGLENFVVNYAYRTYEEQETLFNEMLARYESRYTGDALIARAKREVNYPGTSEFNSGMGFTLYQYKSGEAEFNEKEFFQTEQGKWFHDNGWKYGFILRFPKANYPYEDTVDKAYKTGMNQGLACFRYVGEGHAAVMNHLGLCLEEYIEYLQEHPHIAVFENGVKKYEITRQSVSDAESTYAVEINRLTTNYTMSLDNMGGLITVYKY